MGAPIEANRTLARRLGEAIDRRQLDLLDDIVSSNFVRHCQATPHVVVRDLQQFKAFLRQDAAVFPDSTQTLKHMVAEGNLVSLWLAYAGTQTGQMGPFPPSGKRMEVDCAVVLRIEKGKIAEMWVTWDNLAGLV